MQVDSMLVLSSKLAGTTILNCNSNAKNYNNWKSCWYAQLHSNTAKESCIWHYNTNTVVQAGTMLVVHIKLCPTFTSHQMCQWEGAES